MSQEDCEFKAGLSYQSETLSQNKQTNKQKDTKIKQTKQSTSMQKECFLL
jgi:hypothetical protein